VIVTDVSMPGMGGDELMRRAHELRPTLPVIVIGGGHGYDETRFLEAGPSATCSSLSGPKSWSPSSRGLSAASRN
jgi:CheY-like chemotaxis protein